MLTHDEAPIHKDALLVACDTQCMEAVPLLTDVGLLKVASCSCSCRAYASNARKLQAQLLCWSPMNCTAILPLSPLPTDHYHLLMLLLLLLLLAARPALQCMPAGGAAVVLAPIICTGLLLPPPLPANRTHPLLLLLPLLLPSPSYSCLLCRASA